MKRSSKIFYNIFTSNSQENGYASTRRLFLLNAYLIIGIFAFGLLGLYAGFIEKNYYVAITDVTASSLLIACFYKLRQKKNVQKIINISAIILTSFVYIFLIFNGNKDFGLIWTFFAPMFLITMMGHEKGLFGTIVFFIMILILIFIKDSMWEHGYINKLSLTRYVVAYLMSFFVVFMGEFAIFKLQEELQELSCTDFLTKLKNRRKTEESIKAISNGLNAEENLCIVMADIDDFKSINDTYGHNEGDKVLKTVADIFTKNTTDEDIVGRWGGEEFLMVFAKMNFEEVYAKVVKMKQSIADCDFQIARKVTCSFGICCIDFHNLDINQAIILADKALYLAKEEGKNKIHINHL